MCCSSQNAENLREMEDNFRNDSIMQNRNNSNDASGDGTPSTYNILARDSDLAPAILKEIRIAYGSNEGSINR